MNKCKKSKKVNPRRKPVSEADIQKAKDQAVDDSLTTAIAIILTVLHDKEGVDYDTMQRIWAEVNDLSDSVAKKYVKISDLVKTLDEEYDVKITYKKGLET